MEGLYEYTFYCAEGCARDAEIYPALVWWQKLFLVRVLLEVMGTGRLDHQGLYLFHGLFHSF